MVRKHTTLFKNSLVWIQLCYYLEQFLTYHRYSIHTLKQIKIHKCYSSVENHV